MVPVLDHLHPMDDQLKWDVLSLVEGSNLWVVCHIGTVFGVWWGMLSSLVGVFFHLQDYHCHKEMYLVCINVLVGGAHQSSQSMARSKVIKQNSIL